MNLKGEAGRVVGIYLAAGASRRMGCQKLALQVRGVPLGSIALQAALRSVLDEVVVVTKEEDPLEWIVPDLLASPLRSKWTPVLCVDALNGQAHSMRCGLQEAMRRQAQAVMVLVADQPLVTEQVIDQLIACFLSHQGERSGWEAIAASYRGIPMPPILFDSSLFPMLLTLQGDEGARKILRADSNCAVLNMECEESVFLDIDTPDELDQFRNGELVLNEERRKHYGQRSTLSYN